MYTPWYGMAIFTLVCSILTLWVSEECEKVWGGDPSPLVMDEFAGQGMAFIGIPFAASNINIFMLLAFGFLFFRFFDIKKPLGVNALQKLPGGFGILVDDLLAGFYAFLCVFLLNYLFGYL